jgi:high-affinity iron transporter
MGQAFIIVLREGLEAFLIVAITLAYLRKTAQGGLAKVVAWGILASVVVSGLLGYGLWVSQGVNQPLWEGILGLVSGILIVTLVIHMWRVAPRLKQEMEQHLHKATQKSDATASAIGVFLFTLLMISREGMETALLLFQIQEAQVVAGILLGILAAAAVAFLWQQFGYRINMKHFFQVTAVYLLLFTLQVFVQAFHEFTETGFLPEAWHEASEPFATNGIYGRWYATFTVVGCGLWLAGFWVMERMVKKEQRPSLKAAVKTTPEPVCDGR